MNIKLQFMKLITKVNRKRLMKRLATFSIKGEKFMVPRTDAVPVLVYLHRPACGGENLPVVFNVHGGAWVGGDALLLDTQSQEMADRLGCLVVNINYVKADVKPFPYAQYEVRDTVLYFVRHAREYGIDTSKLALMGYSAGGHLCACAAQLLSEEGVQLSCQVLCYPFLDFTFAGEAHNEMADGMTGVGEIFFPTLSKTDPLVSPGLLPDEKLKNLAPAMIITCGHDQLQPQANRYKARLENAGVKVQLFDYPESLHGFLECNYPETEDSNSAKSPEQAAQCVLAQTTIEEALLKIWSEQ